MDKPEAQSKVKNTEYGTIGECITEDSLFHQLMEPQINTQSLIESVFSELNSLSDFLEIMPNEEVPEEPETDPSRASMQRAICLANKNNSSIIKVLEHLRKINQKLI